MASKIYMEKTSRVEAPGCEPGSCCLTQALGCGLAPSPQAEKAAARQDQLRAAGDILVNSCRDPFISAQMLGRPPGVSLGSLGPSRQWRVVIGGMGARQLET